MATPDQVQDRYAQACAAYDVAWQAHEEARVAFRAGTIDPVAYCRVRNGLEGALEDWERARGAYEAMTDAQRASVGLRDPLAATQGDLFA